MSTWRRLAIELFPNRRKSYENKYTSYDDVFVHLILLAQDSHNTTDKREIKKAFKYAEWCFKQKRRFWDLWDSSLYFYLKLAENEETSQFLIEFLSDRVFGEFINSHRVQTLDEDIRRDLLTKYNKTHRTSIKLGELR